MNKKQLDPAYRHAPFLKQFFLGQRARVVFGSGLDSDRVGVIKQVRGSECVLRDERGEFTMFKSRLVAAN